MKNKVIRVSAIIILTLVSVFCFPHLAQAHGVSGDYFYNNFPTTQEGQLINKWQVMSPELNCFSRAGKEFDSLTSFVKGETLTVPVSLGRISNIDPIYLDSRGNPWMIVIGSNNSRFGNDGVCFIRANEEFVVPE